MRHQGVQGEGQAAPAEPSRGLDASLELAVAPGAPPVPRPAHTLGRALTRRGILWLGQTCNLRCFFCYYLDRIEDPHHPEHAFMPLAKATAICRTLVESYGNDSVDIQGGEPTLYGPILDLVRACRDMGLSPTIISNALALDRPGLAEAYRDAGLRDFLVSVQGLGAVYDEIVRRPGSSARQMRALRRLQEAGVRFRFNTVLTRPALPQLAAIAELGVRTGAQVVNFLAFNPFDDQRDPGHRSAANVPRYAELTAPLGEALDRLEAAGVEANVRYVPLCFVPERHRRSAYNFQQLSYDLHENDFASWSWTGQGPQRTAAGGTTPPPKLGPRVRLGALREPLRALGRRADVGPALLSAKRTLDRWTSAFGNRVQPDRSRDAIYRDEARLRAIDHLNYRQGEGCRRCDLQAICDGFHGDYAALHGLAEARPVSLGGPTDDPQHFTRDQLKVLDPEDAGWLEVATSGPAPAWSRTTGPVGDGGSGTAPTAGGTPPALAADEPPAARG